MCQTRAAFPIGADDVVIGCLPFFHIYGMSVIMNQGLRAGATTVTMPRFDLEQFLELMEEYGVTRAYVVPPIALALAKHPAVEGHDLSALKTIMSGAAALGADLAEQVSERVGALVIQGYGLTETSPVTHVTPDDPSKNKPGSIGPLVPNTEARVVDIATGADLGPNEDGEFWIRGPQVMMGYLNNPTATANTIDAEGWLHTGDIGHADDQGYFTIVDRLKELIKYKGYQVPPATLEAVLLSHPAVVDAAVVPHPDVEAGEIPKAFVVKEGEVTDRDLIEYVAERVAPHERVRVVEFIEEIPKSASGKILRRVLKERDRERVGQG
jgi:acyl-CoA synthetase (AMP-forming)/AMP-acid ligase II